MTNHATEGSREAEQTEKHASEVATDAAGLNTVVGELRWSVLSVVRTTTAEVDGVESRTVRKA